MEGKELVALSATIIAAILAIAKLIADKESRTSDFRKDWIGTFRGALAELLGEAYVISGRIWIRVQHVEALRNHKCIASPVLSKEDIDALEEELTSHWNTLRKAHRTVLLHLNFGETAWGLPHVTQDVTPEQKIEGRWKLLIRNSTFSQSQQPREIYQTSQNGSPSGAAALLVSELERLIKAMLGPYDEVGTKERHEFIKRSIDDATLLGNLVLKPEWNRIKEGERNYRKAIGFLKFLGALGVIALAILSFSGSKSSASARMSTITVSMSSPQTGSTHSSAAPINGLLRPTGPNSDEATSPESSWPVHPQPSSWPSPQPWLPPSESTQERP